MDPIFAFAAEAASVNDVQIDNGSIQVLELDGLRVCQYGAEPDEDPERNKCSAQHATLQSQIPRIIDAAGQIDKPDAASSRVP